MSLLLRENTQELLNQFGLNSFHTEITSTKHLAIVTRCGEPFVIISGIKFSKMQLTQKEIEIATKLFKEFLEINQQKIEDYISAYEHFYSLPEIEQFTEKYQINSFGNDCKNYSINVLDDKKRKLFLVTTRGTITFSSIEFTRNKIIDLMQSNEIDEALHYLQQYVAYKQEEEKFFKVKAELNKCNI